MKARIYKPAPWYTTNRLENWYTKRKYGDEYLTVDFPVDRQDRIVEFILDDIIQAWFLHPINRIRQKLHPKNKIRIDPADTWSMDSTLSPIILPMLKQLRTTKHGSPFVDDEDVPEELRSTSAKPLTEEEKQVGSTDEFFHQRWNWVMDEMIFAFEKKCDENWESEFHSGELEFLCVPIDKDGNDLGPPKELYDTEYNKPEGLHAWRMERGPNDTSKWDREGQQKVQERISNGLRLFGKYYEALWD